MVPADKNELLVQKESELPGEEKIYDRCARNRFRVKANSVGDKKRFCP